MGKSTVSMAIFNVPNHQSDTKIHPISKAICLERYVDPHIGDDPHATTIGQESGEKVGDEATQKRHHKYGV
jgi:hypothetical protein